MLPGKIRGRQTPQCPFPLKVLRQDYLAFSLHLLLFMEDMNSVRFVKYVTSEFFLTGDLSIPFSFFMHNNEGQMGDKRGTKSTHFWPWGTKSKILLHYWNLILFGLTSWFLVPLGLLSSFVLTRMLFLEFLRT